MNAGAGVVGVHETVGAIRARYVCRVSIVLVSPFFQSTYFRMYVVCGMIMFDNLPMPDLIMMLID